MKLRTRDKADFRVLTDDHNNLFQILKESTSSVNYKYKPYRTERWKIKNLRTRTDKRCGAIKMRSEKELLITGCKDIFSLAVKDFIGYIS